jgi:uncharacterized protein
VAAKKTLKILSIDGGGIRGIIPGLVMAEIEARTGKPISELFDLIAGTSTGGVLALGLTCPDRDNPQKPRYSAAEGVRMYEKDGARIFSRSAWQMARTVNGLIDERYPRQPLEEVLKEYLGETTRLRDSLTDVMITSYEIERRIPWFFRSQKAKTDPSYDFELWQVARATSAAPTFFEACRIDIPDTDNYYALVDGGVFANNPTMCAYVDAMSRYKDYKDYLVVSLGTGTLTQPVAYAQAKDWGMAEWVVPVINILMNGNSETVDYQMQQVLPVQSKNHRYYRFQIRLDKDMDAMDNAAPENLRKLRLLAENLIRDQRESLTSLCEALTKT